MKRLDGEPGWSGDPFSDSLEMQREASEVGFNWERASDVVDKLREEIDELDAAIRDGDPDAIAHEIGDLFLALINIARMLELDPRHTMQRANERFRDRFLKMRALIESQGKALEQCSLAELDRAWDAAKRVEDAN